MRKTLPPPSSNGGSNALLDTGLPNPFPTPPPLLSGVTSTDPLLNYAPAAGDPPPSSAPCPSGTPPSCVLTVQYNNARQDGNLAENVLTVANVSAGSTSKSVFMVDQSGLRNPVGSNPPFPTNPVYAQPLYVAGLTIGTGTYNVLYIAALNGEVYGYSANHASVATSTCAGGAGTSGCLWFRDETNTSGMRGLKHNCDTTSGYGHSVVGSAIPNFLDFAGTISTPVIDPKGAAAAIYVTNLCIKPDGTEHWYLNALDLKTGADLGSPAEITYSTIVSSPNGPQQAFFPANQLQRPGLLLDTSSNCSSPPCRSVIASFGPSVAETTVQYQGWMFAYNGNSPSTLKTQTPDPYTTECYYPAETSTPPNPVPCNAVGASEFPTSADRAAASGCSRADRRRILSAKCSPSPETAASITAQQVPVPTSVFLPATTWQDTRPSARRRSKSRWPAYGTMAVRGRCRFGPTTSLFHTLSPATLPAIPTRATARTPAARPLHARTSRR